MQTAVHIVKSPWNEKRSEILTESCTNNTKKKKTLNVFRYLKEKNVRTLFLKHVRITSKTPYGYFFFANHWNKCVLERNYTV